MVIIGDISWRLCGGGQAGSSCRPSGSCQCARLVVTGSPPDWSRPDRDEERGVSAAYWLYDTNDTYACILVSSLCIYSTIHS